MTENKKRFITMTNHYGTSRTYCTGIYDNQDNYELTSARQVINKLNALHEENEQLKKDVEYWKQVASQYSNELNVFEHCKKYKTECKDIYWSSD